MGLISSFAAEASFGAHSFRNKCPVNKKHRTHQGRTLKCYEEKEAMRTNMANCKLCMRSEVQMKMRTVRRFLYLHVFYMKER